MRARILCIHKLFVFLIAAGALFQIYPAIGEEGQSDTILAKKLVYEGRKTPRVVACVACHRVSGQGDASSAFGNLTGLTEDYLSKQLRDYRSGVRENRVMQVIAGKLLDLDIKALAKFYSKMTPPKSTMAIPEAPGRGVKLVEEGDNERGIMACIACHGHDTRKSNNKVPNLHGQHALYIVNQLTAWQEGTRKNDPDSVMSQIAKKLTQDEIAAVAIYFARRARAGSE